jgi:ribosomal protein S6--L-glutamate ligase
MLPIYLLTAEPKNFVPVQLKAEAEKLGYECTIIDIRHTFIVETTGKSKVMYKVDDDKLAELKPPFACIPRLNEHHIMYKLNVLNRLVADGAYMVNTPEAMGLCNDKLGSQVALNSAGIQTPYSTVIGSLDMLDLTLKQVEEDGQLKFPMIIKTLRGTHGIGVMKVDSKSSLVSVAQAFLANSGSEVMLQEFIEHKESLRIIMIGDDLLAANRRGQPKEKDEFRTNSHLGSETEKYEPNEEELALARKIVELFGARFCAIDYIQHNGQLIVLEVNGSPGLEAIQKNWEDKNLPEAVIKGLVKLSGKHDAPFVPGSGEPAVVDGIYDGIPVSEPKIAPEIEPAVPNGIEGSLDVPHNDAPVQVTPNVNGDQPLGDTEQLVIVRLADQGMHARVDTGAAFCSLHAEDVGETGGWVKFKRDGITYRVSVDRHVKIRNAHGKSTRPLIKLDIILRGVRYNQVEFSVTSRADMKYDALIGRNLLKIAGIPVLVPNDDNQRAADLPPSDIEVEEE